MIAESNFLVSLLKLTKNGVALARDVKTDARLPSDLVINLLRRLQDEGLLGRNNTIIEINGKSRLKLAIKAVSLGADIESVSNLLNWQEFESITASALESYDYSVRQNLRFKHAARRWEMDIVGCKKPLVVCVECKSWHRSISPSAMKRVVESQLERTRALSEILPNVKLGLECTGWSRANFVPVVLVLAANGYKFFNEVPIVPVLQLRDFLSNLPMELKCLKYFTREFANLCHDS
jgi:Holliday junction resolvase-like predicted endonuclease